MCFVRQCLLGFLCVYYVFCAFVALVHSFWLDDFVLSVISVPFTWYTYLDLQAFVRPAAAAVLVNADACCHIGAL